MTAAHDPQWQTEEVDLVQFLHLVWRWKWLVGFFCAVLTAAAAAAAFVLPKQYEASVIAAPVSGTSGAGEGGLSSMLSQFGGIAALAGLSLRGDDTKNESLAVLSSNVLARGYIAKHDLLPILFSRKWDAASSKWKDGRQGKFPTLWTGTEYFNKRVRSVSTDTRTGLVSLRISWTDPDLAAEWANGLMSDANQYLRERAIAESERNIKYLSEAAEKTSIVGVRDAVYTVLQNEINKVMLARGTDQYAFRVVDPAVVPEKPASPRPILWSLLGFSLGLVVSLIACFVAFFLGAKKDLT